MPKLSIITVNKNNGGGLIRTIDSVLNQNSDDFEYIIVDGGSTDGSLDVLNQFSSEWQQKTSRKLHWISEQDEGIYHAMNKGINLANGEYCQFLNSGDYLVSTTVTSSMLSNMSNDDIVYGNMLKILPNGSVFYNKKLDNISMLTFYKGTLNHSSAYIKKSLFDKYGMYDQSLKIVSDWKFFLITIGLNNVKPEYLDIDVTYFDMSGISNTNSELDKRERRMVLKELLPANVLNDYDSFWFDIEQVRRIKRYSFTSKFFWFIERTLFKFEKFKSRQRKEHLFF